MCQLSLTNILQQKIKMKIWLQGRSRSFVSWEDFHNEMFKVKETLMTQYIGYMSDYI